MKTKNGTRNRNKGHRYERWLAQCMRNLGFSKCVTARQGSRIADNAGIDLINVPMNIQAKSGYSKGLNYTQIFEDMEKGLDEYFMEEDPIRSYPSVIAHKKGRKKSEHLVIMKFDDFMELLKQLYE